MGIVKVNLRRPQDEIHVTGNPSTSRPYEFKQREEVLHDNGSDDDFEDSESAEVGSELVALGNESFTVPYDLYDLLDLKGILSLETWNICLTEEERLLLTTFLPDMDLETFLVTMNELLRGENIFFGSPLDIFFHRLKGGICSLKVSCFRDGLQILEKWKHYHFLCSYHDNMVRTFLDMQRTWSSCQPSISVKEKVCIWKKRKDMKPMFVVDLNALPTEEEFLTKNEEDAVKSMKKTKTMDTKAVGPAAMDNMALAGTLAKPRGVLKIKMLKTTTPNAAVQVLPTPRGLLKVKHQTSFLQPKQKPRLTHIHSELVSEPSNFHASSNRHQASRAWDAEFYDDSRSIIPQVRGENSKRSQSPGLGKCQHRREVLTKVNGSEALQEPILPWKTPRASKWSSHVPGGLAYQNANNFRHKPRSVDVGNREDFSGAERPYAFVSGHYQGSSRDIASLTPTRPSIKLAISNDEHDAFARFSTPQPGRGIQSIHTGENPSKPSEVDNSGILHDGRAFRMTYKRKKESSKHNPSDILKQKTYDGNFEHKTQEQIMDHPPVEKAKSVKIKLKILNK